MLGLGRIFGATGIVSGFVLAESRSEFARRAALVLGMVLAPGLIFLVTGGWPALDVPVSPAMIAVGGVIVMNPAKVLNVFDIAGSWDLSLAFVMGGAVVVTFIGYRLVWRRAKPLFEDRFQVPNSKVIDARLVGGSALFPGAVVVGLALAPILRGQALLPRAARGPSAATCSLGLDARKFT
jgi:hypothetical protein